MCIICVLCIHIYVLMWHSVRFPMGEHRVCPLYHSLTCFPSQWNFLLISDLAVCELQKISSLCFPTGLGLQRHAWQCLAISHGFWRFELRQFQVPRALVLVPEVHLTSDPSFHPELGFLMYINGLPVSYLTPAANYCPPGQADVTKYHRVGDLNNKHWFCTVWEVVIPRSRCCRSVSCSYGLLFLFACGKSCVLSFPYKGTNPILNLWLERN